MPLDTARARRYLEAFDFKTLFVEGLGWNRVPGRPLDIAVEGLTYRLQPVAEKAGFQVFECLPDAQGGIPKRFYDRFKTEHTAFAKFLNGIPDDDLARWYVSVMLNRLMFIYFIQKKGFLNGDDGYLRHKLAASMERGQDRFYREFLTPLFF